MYDKCDRCMHAANAIAFAKSIPDSLPNSPEAAFANDLLLNIEMPLPAKCSHERCMEDNCNKPAEYLVPLSKQDPLAFDLRVCLNHSITWDDVSPL